MSSFPPLRRRDLNASIPGEILSLARDTIYSAVNLMGWDWYCCDEGGPESYPRAGPKAGFFRIEWERDADGRGLHVWGLGKYLLVDRLTPEPVRTQAGP